MCRIKNAIAIVTSNVFSLGLRNPADDLPPTDLPWEGSSLADMIATLDCRIQFSRFGAVDQMLMSLQNALRLELTRPVQCKEESGEKPSSLDYSAAEDGCGRKASGGRKGCVSHWRNLAMVSVDPEDASDSPARLCRSSHLRKNVNAMAPYQAGASSPAHGNRRSSAAPRRFLDLPARCAQNEAKAWEVNMFKDLFSLQGRVALVTGGSRGIGRMIAAGFLAQGAVRVYITARKAAPCEASAKELTAQYDGECIALPIDISNLAGIEMLAAEIKKREPQLDILVNNAGAAWGAEFDEFPESGWDKVANLNLKTPFFLTKALAAPLRAAASADKPAKVINIASIDGIFVNPMETYSYAASKAGLIHLTRRMAAKLIRDHVVVTAIAPGPFASDMNRAARDHADAVATRVPLGRIGDENDMAGAAIFLASRAGDYVVGATLPVDGGIVYANAGIAGSGWDH
jgi:NAD(P)-dependent dehydrogenase (short-subunit alcohol dehydrogenase family)